MDIPSSGLRLTHRQIVHPTDFSSGGDPAFRHALKLALAARAHFTLLHVDDAQEADGFDQFPRVRPLLVQWGALPPNAPQEQVQALGLYVKKVRAASPNPALAVVQHLTTHPSDLVVLATHRRGGLSRWIQRSVAEPIVRGVQAPALLVPEGVDGFIREADGQSQLRRILMPASHSDRAQIAAESIAQVGDLLGCDDLTIHMIHIADTHLTPAFRPPQRPGWTWEATRTTGELVPAILRVATEMRADLIVMPTEGHTSWGDTLQGSTTEQVLRQAPCPVLAIPIH